MPLVNKADAKTGFWITIGVLGALLAYSFLSARIPAIKPVA